MDNKELQGLLKDEKKLNKKIEAYLKNKTLVKQEVNQQELKGHIEKAEHNASFVKDALGTGYSDWAVVGCYYSSYHMALALISKKGYFSKNHDATLCVLIKEYINTKLSAEDIEMLNKIYLDNEDVLFYVKSRKEREKASYSTQIAFDKKEVEELRSQTLLFIRKAQEIIKE